MERYCKTCFDLLVRGELETKQNFSKRTHCGRKCVKKPSGKQCRHVKMVGYCKEAKS